METQINQMVSDRVKPSNIIVEIIRCICYWPVSMGIKLPPAGVDGVNEKLWEIFYVLYILIIDYVMNIIELKWIPYGTGIQDKADECINKKDKQAALPCRLLHRDHFDRSSSFLAKEMAALFLPFAESRVSTFL